MPSIELVVQNPTGLHARPAMLFARAAGACAARVTIENLDREGPPVDAKSLILVLSKGVERGHRIRLTAEGPDADEALRSLRELVESGIGEGAEGAKGA
ncbi:MAG: HPr family phosphocarrier protein [Chloroflexi bacterium]|nr:MAG: HPr family phosphocarrier protein [Chloroflexota bacterium]